MIKHTPQEIADFFGCYVAQDKEGPWYLYYDGEEPIQWSYSKWYVDSGRYIDITKFVIEPENHNWRHLYKPQLDNKATANYSKPTDFDNKKAYLVEKDDEMPAF